MKSWELRIGNNILDTEHPERLCRVFRLTSGNEHSITYSYDKAFEHCPKDSSVLQGIPLNEETWKALGFTVLFPCGENAGNRVVEYRGKGKDGFAGEWLEFPFQFTRTIYPQESPNKIWRLLCTDYSEELIKRCGLAWSLRNFQYVHEIQNLFLDIVERPLEYLPIKKTETT